MSRHIICDKCLYFPICTGEFCLIEHYRQLNGNKEADRMKNKVVHMSYEKYIEMRDKINAIEGATSNNSSPLYSEPDYQTLLKQCANMKQKIDDLNAELHSLEIDYDTLRDHTDKVAKEKHDLEMVLLAIKRFCMTAIDPDPEEIEDEI